MGKRRAQVPKVFRTAHSGENVASVGKKWADMGKEQQRAWLRNQRLQQSAEAHRQARTVALPCAAGGASSRAQPHDHRVSRVRYAALEKDEQVFGITRTILSNHPITMSPPSTLISYSANTSTFAESVRESVHRATPRPRQLKTEATLLES